MTTAGIPAAVLHKTQMGALLPEDALLIQTAIKEMNTDGQCEKSKYIQYSLLDMFLIYVI